MLPTRFPPKTRQVLATTASAQYTRPVATEDELRAAIDEIAARGGSTEDPGSAFGATISIVAPFSVGRPVVIPEGCIGLTIEAVAKFPITARGVVSSLFEVDALAVTIRDLFVWATSTANMFTTFVTIPTTAADPDRVAVLNNFVFADRLFVDQNGLAAGAMVVGNEHRKVSTTAAAAVHSAATKGVCADNNLPDGGGNTIFIGTEGLGAGNGGGRWRLVGNDCNGGDIKTDESNGGTYLASNSNVGTKTLHASDIDADAVSAPSGWTTVTKTATETVTASMVLQNDDALKFAMLANTTYRFRATLHATSTSTAPDIRVSINGPAAATLIAWGAHQLTNLAAGVSSNAYGATLAAQITSTAPAIVVIEGTIQNGANAGDLQVQWAQNTSDAAATNVLKGSYLEYAVVA